MDLPSFTRPTGAPRSYPSGNQSEYATSAMRSMLKRNGTPQAQLNDKMAGLGYGGTVTPQAQPILKPMAQDPQAIDPQAQMMQAAQAAKQPIMNKTAIDPQAQQAQAQKVAMQKAALAKLFPNR